MGIFCSGVLIRKRNRDERGPAGGCLRPVYCLVVFLGVSLPSCVLFAVPAVLPGLNLVTSCSKKCAEAILSSRKTFQVRIMPFSVVKSIFQNSYVCTRGYVPRPYIGHCMLFSFAEVVCTRAGRWRLRS